MNMGDKICIVTGATDGIGRVTALGLAQSGARVIVVGRDEAKGARVVEALQRETSNEWVEFEHADLSVQADVRALADRLTSRLARLDVLVNNAGAFFYRRELSRDGLEMTFALNHLGYFLLTGLFLDLLKQSGAGRIVNVASAAHKGPQVDFDDLQGERRYSGWRAYQQSKLANILFTYRLAEKLGGTGVSANCLHPGFVASKFGHNNRGLVRLIMIVSQKLAAIGEEQGAQTSLYLANSDEVANVSGCYFREREAAVSSPASQDKAAQARLWEISEGLTGLSYP